MEVELRDFFFHEHPLMLTETTREVMICHLCFQDFERPFYSCCECQFVIHDICAESELRIRKTCAELPKVFQNSYHPHPLTLVTRLEKEAFRCAVCLQNHLGFAYHCGNCNFDLDIGCAFQKLAIDEGQDQLHHLTHPHPLIAMEKKKQDDHDDVSCKICGEPIYDVLYGCDPCNFYLHQSCAELQLPTTIQHFYHPCLLTLCLDARQSYCRACDNFCGFYSYFCKPCNFRIEISCALLPVIMESQGQQQFHHFCHGHPLNLKDIKHEDKILCSACNKCCSGETYVCCSSKCKFFLHISCFNLPRNIHHQLHPHHPLTMYSRIQKTYNPTICRVCYRFCSGFTYSCNHCREFDVDVVCPAAISTIEYLGHCHNLLFADGLDADSPALWCSACGNMCESSTPVFHCAQCNFHLHFNCGPLPCFIKHENHPCPLKLTDSPVMIDGGDKGGDWFICDVCEEDRDPRLPVYYCSKGCAYIAEIECVISEVLDSLLGENGNVELRSTIFKHKTGKVVGKGIVKGIELVQLESIADSDAKLCKPKVNSSFTMEEIINAISELEKRNIQTVLESTPSSDQDHDLWLTEEGALLYSDKDFRKLISLMDAYDHNEILKDLSRSKKEVVNVGNHLVISDLASVLGDLCAKYGEIILESTLQSSGARTIFVHMLCETLRDMSITRIADMSPRQLILWWRSLKTLQHVGFKVEFVFTRLKRVVPSYYAFERERKAKEDLEQILKEMEKVSKAINKLEANLVAEKAKLGRLKKRYKRRELPEHASSSILVNSFKEAAEHRWAVVGEGLL